MKKKDIDDVGMFNVLLIGENTHSISIADNIKNKFCSNEVENQLKFNIVDDIERDVKSNSWSNEFIFETTSLSRFNNIPMSVGFYKWMCNAKTMEWLYMKKLLQAMNVVIVDVDDSNDDMVVFDEDIPQCKFNSNKDFLGDLIKWIDCQLSKLTPKMNTIRLIKSFGGKNLPFLGDVFGCLSGKKYSEIISTDTMRFDVPILFDEFCKLSKGRTIDELEGCVFTRTNSALSMFLK